MKTEKLLSLVIPTNGVTEWVIPVIDSIYNQNVDENLFEVVITDNGNNSDFEEMMGVYISVHENLIYKKTSAVLFMNQIEGFKIASGIFIKFVNHRFRLVPGSIEYLINYTIKNQVHKPITFFLNDTHQPESKDIQYSKFDSFVFGLSNMSSWSGGVSCWKSDLDKFLDESFNIYKDGLFPHLCFVYVDLDNREYSIDSTKIFEEIPSDSVKKGSYNLFYAFGIEYLDYLFDLYRNGAIECTTWEYVKNNNEKFITNLYADYVILKKKNPYDLSSYREYLDKYYSFSKVKLKAFILLMNRLYKKIIPVFRRNRNE